MDREEKNISCRDSLTSSQRTVEKYVIQKNHFVAYTLLSLLIHIKNIIKI